MIFTIENIEIDSAQRKLTRSGELIDVEPQVFDVLLQLIENSERMLTKDELLESVWKGRFVSESALSSRIKAARQAVGDNGRDQRVIRTIHGRGFQCVAKVTRHSKDAPVTISQNPSVTLKKEVTFLLSDVESQNNIRATQAEAFANALSQYQQIMQDCLAVIEGVEVTQQGTLFAIAFEQSDAAIRMAVDIQSELQSIDWSPLDSFVLRIALHQGEADSIDGHYSGDAFEATRSLLSAVDGGQIATTEPFYRAVKSPELTAMFSYAGAFNLHPLGDHVHLYKVCSSSMVHCFRPLRAEMGVRTNLPRRRNELIGREHEIFSVLDKFNTSELVSIIGPGGVGKTSLAMEVAHQLLANHAGGVWLCELVSVDEEQVTSAIIESIAQGKGSGQGEIAKIIEHLSGESTTLVLDNCEHVIDVVAEIAEQLLEKCPSLTILVTSREALDILGENILRIQGLDCQGADSAAVEFFVQRAKKLTDLKNDEETLEVVEQIVKKLEGLPLAIELAVPRLASSSPSELLVALNDQLSVLGSRRRNSSHQSTMDRTIAWSFDLLSSEEQSTLVELSIFSGAFTTEAASGICSGHAVGTSLHRLVEQSMVVHVNTNQGTRYRLLEPIQQFVSRRLIDEPKELIAERHATYFAKRIATLADELRSPNEPAAAQHLTVEWPDIGHALAWGRKHLRADIAIDPLIALEFHLIWQLRWEGYIWLKAAIDCFDDLGERQASVDLIMSIAVWRSGDLEGSEKLLAKAVKAQGITNASQLMEFLLAMLCNDFKRLAERGDLFWEFAQTTNDHSWQVVASAVRLIARVLANPDDPEIDSIAAEMDRQVDSTDWPTGHCWGLLSHVTKCVRQQIPDQAIRVRIELDRVVRECGSFWFALIAGGLADNSQSKKQKPIDQLEAAIKSLQAAQQADDLMHLPLTTRAVLIWLEATQQKVVAAQLLGYISTQLEATKVFRQLSVGYDETVERLELSFPDDEFEQLLSTGRRMTLKQIIDLCKSALEVARIQSAGEDQSD